MKDLFLVESPLQLLCAYELIGREERDFTLVIRLNGSQRNDSQMLLIAELLELNYIRLEINPIFVFRDSLSELPRIFGVLSKRYKRVFIGSYFSRFFFSLKKFFRADDIFMLDDGVATFLAQMKMEESKKIFDIATFFKVSPLRGQRVIRHSFERIREKFDSTSEICSVFVGQPLVDRGMLRSDIYLDLIREALKRTGGVLNYYPHRSESEKIVEEISKIQGIKVVKTDLCIELHLLKNKLRPVYVFSSISSALFSLSAIFPEGRYFACVSNKFDGSMSPHLDEIVKSLRCLRNVDILEF